MNRKNPLVKFLSSILLATGALIFTAIIAAPYYYAAHIMSTPDNKADAWFIIICWTWLVYAVSFHKVIDFIDKGKDEGKTEDSEGGENTTENT